VLIIQPSLNIVALNVETHLVCLEGAVSYIPSAIEVRPLIGIIADIVDFKYIGEGKAVQNLNVDALGLGHLVIKTADPFPTLMFPFPLFSSSRILDKPHSH